MNIKRGMWFIVLIVLVIFLSGIVFGATCKTGETDCSGTCVDIKTSSSNCGACGTACKTGESCSSGKCVTSSSGNTCDSDSECGKGSNCVAGVCKAKSAGTTNSGKLPVNTDRTQVLGANVEAPAALSACDYENEGDHLDCFRDASPAGSYLYGGSGYVGIDDSDRAGIVLKPKGIDAGDCTLASVMLNKKQPGAKGCKIVIVEDDSAEVVDDDDGAMGEVKKGFVLSYDYDRVVSSQKKYDEFIEIYGQFEFTRVLCDADDARDALEEAYFQTEFPYICADDVYWHKCETKGKITWANDYLYNCTDDENLNLYWDIRGIDKDHDGYTDDKDCADDPHGEGMQLVGCPTDLSKEVCDPVKHSRCAICINPGRPETCGDGLNNDCDLGKKSLKQLDGLTKDNCHLNRYACEKKQGIDKDGIEYGPTHTNIFGETLSWKEVKNSKGKDGYCCGFEGAKDLGKIATGKEGNFICLNRNKQLTGSATGKIPGWDTKICGDTWCWIWATGAAAFQITTVKKPGEQPYDIVSNNKEWHECKANLKDQKLPFTLSKSKTLDYEWLEKITNRFRCYQEGNHWSWTECYGKNDKPQNKNAKGRVAGDGVYSLFIDVKGEKIGSTIELKSSDYSLFYGKNYAYDFSGYDNLEFMLRFVDKSGKPVGKDKLTLPANVRMLIYGPKQVDEKGKTSDLLYLDQNVLGYVINGPHFSDQNWMHVKVPILNLKGVQSIILKSAREQDKIAVKNVYLSKGNSSLTPLCSGKDTRDYNSWISNIDQADKTNPITGEEICKDHYGANSWLGSYGKKEVETITASCCGNSPKEYYGKNSKNNYGCWNSQSIKPGATIMNTKFTVISQETQVEMNYPEISFDYVLEVENPLSNQEVLSVSTEPKTDCDKSKKDKIAIYKGYIYKCSGLQWKRTEDRILDYNLQSKKVDEDIKKLAQKQTKTDKISITSGPIKLLNWSGEIKNVVPFINILNRYWDTPKKLTLNFTHKTTNKNDQKMIKLKIIDSNSLTEYEESVDLLKLKGTKADFFLMAEITDYYSIKKKIDINKTSKPITKEYTCDQEECLFPLPGFPPYTITNPYPELYELYFVDNTGETLVTKTNNKFTKSGNLKAKKVSQQVIFINQKDDSSLNKTQDQGFYGCQAAKFIEDVEVDKKKLLTNLPYCSVKGNYFCSFSVPHTKNQEKYNTINAWSKEDLTQIGYSPLTAKESVPTYFSLIKNSKISPTKRNYSSSVVPGKNFVSNPEFSFQGKILPHWEIFKNNKLETDEKQYLKSDKETLLIPTGVILKSEKIAIPKNQDLSFSQNKSGKVIISLVNKDGKITPVTSNLKFNTGKNSYLFLEFTGEVNKPFLQVVDELGRADYKYNTNYLARSGSACCPDNYCWNGYACIKPMDTYSYMTEKIGKGREYRCLQGAWKYLPPQWDWNYNQYGFCNQPKQCFVLSSLSGGNSKYLANDFYEGKIPSCVNNEEYIFDNYCENGNWTSRTKYLADTLINFAESDEYVLYCTDYKGTLIDYRTSENYIGGSVSAKINKSVTLGSAIENKTVVESSKACFPKLLGGTGEKLIAEKDNTCINNVCVLRFKEGGKFKTAFATSLNKKLNDTSSFLRAMNLDPKKVVCPTGKDFVKCTSSLTGDLWYNNQTNSIIYGKEGIKVSGTVWGKVKKWFSSLFGGPKITQEKKMVQKGTVFRELFLLNKDKKKIRAVQEIFPKKKALIVEYEGFKSPVCDYLNHLKVPLAAQSEVLESASGLQKLNCTTNGTIQKFVAVESLDYWWPQLTGMLRVGK